MKRLIAGIASAAICLAAPTCLTFDENGLIGIGETLVCTVATSGLPFSGHVDYCSVIDINLPINNDEEDMAK